MILSSKSELTLIYVLFVVQREFEQRAAIMGGGNFVVPAQRVTDFLENKLSGRKFLILNLSCLPNLQLS